MTDGRANMDSENGRFKEILRKWAGWTFRLLVVTVSLITLLIILTPQGRTAFHTTLFVLQVLDAPVKPQSWFTGELLRHEVRYETPNGTEVAEVYRTTMRRRF